MALAWTAVSLSHTSKLVLLSLADNANDSGVCWPSIQNIACRCSLDERSIYRAIGVLEEAGHLSSQPRPGKSTVYRVHPRQAVTPDSWSPLTACQVTPDTVSGTPDSLSGTPDSLSPIIIKNLKEPSLNRKRRTSFALGVRLPCERVFQHWREEFNHPKAVLDPRRRRGIQRALESYDEPTLREAISGYKLSPHHMGQNEQRTVYDDINLILRSSEHIERGLNFARAPPVAVKSAVQLAQENLQRSIGGGLNDSSVVSEQDGHGESDLGSSPRLLRGIAHS